MIDTLIDKQDTFEIVRDKIAAILATEVANQMQLASAVQKDPALWNLRIFTERFNPFEEWLNPTEDGTLIIDDETPIVNIWFDNAVLDAAASDRIERQKTDATYNIDIYGLGVAKKETVGFSASDYLASIESHRATRLVRNILMSANYAYLELRGIVWGRWIESLNSFYPELNGRQGQRIVGTRIKFNVQFNETAPQITPGVLDSLFVAVKRTLDGQVLAEAEYDVS
jgi:hypothetical protein